jgi:hypothetical protein
MVAAVGVAVIIASLLAKQYGIAGSTRQEPTG